MIAEIGPTHLLDFAWYAEGMEQTAHWWKLKIEEIEKS